MYFRSCLKNFEHFEWSWLKLECKNTLPVLSDQPIFGELKSEDEDPSHLVLLKIFTLPSDQGNLRHKEYEKNKAIGSYMLFFKEHCINVTI